MNAMRHCGEPSNYKERFMRTASQELTLSSALADPLIRTLMAADNVDPVKLESMLRRIAEENTPGLSPTAKS
jgi:hypothetical protein